MTLPDIAPTPPAKSPVGVRILIFAGGILLLAVGALITLGTELLAVLGILIAAFVYKRRGKRLTRGAAWVSAVGGTMIPVLILLVTSMIRSPITPPTAEERRAALEHQKQIRDSMPEFFKKLTARQQQQQPAVDSMADKLLQNKKVMLWFGGMAAVMGSAMVAAFAGTLGWGASMLLYRGARDEWLGAPPFRPLDPPEAAI